MDQEIRERLMIDDALGVLEPDVQALLSAYLEASGAGESERKEWRKLAAAARDVMPVDEEEEVLPPFPRPQVYLPRIWRTAQVAVAAAALVVFGFGLGHTRVVAPVNNTEIARATAAPTAPMASFGVHDFWSPERIMAAAIQARQQNPPAWHPVWPMDIPQTGAQQ
jgi:hypothetical protein